MWGRRLQVRFFPWLPSKECLGLHWPVHPTFCSNNTMSTNSILNIGFLDASTSPYQWVRPSIGPWTTTLPKQLTKIAVSYPCLGWGSVTLLQLPLEQKIAQPMTTDFSLYETFLEMENEGHLGKFYIIQPWQNWDNWLNKPVSQFHFDADIDRDIFTK